MTRTITTWDYCLQDYYQNYYRVGLLPVYYRVGLLVVGPFPQRTIARRSAIVLVFAGCVVGTVVLVFAGCVVGTVVLVFAGCIAVSYTHLRAHETL